MSEAFGELRTAGTPMIYCVWVCGGEQQQPERAKAIDAQSKRAGDVAKFVPSFRALEVR